MAEAEAEVKLRRLNDLSVELFKEKRFEELVELFAEDSCYFPAGSPACHGRQDILRYYQAQAAKGLWVEMKDVKLEVEILSSDVALLSHFCDIYVQGQSIGKSNSITVWKRHGEKWLIHRDMFNMEN